MTSGFLFLAPAFFCLASAAFGQVHVLTYHNNNRRTGENLAETILTQENVNSNTFGKLGAYNVDGYVYAQPLYVSHLSIPGQGSHNVVFVATEHNSVYAFDADGNQGPAHGLLWQTNLGTAAVTPNSVFGNRYGAYPDIRPEVGITGTPVIDLAAETLYVDAFTYEGAAYLHRIHALSLTNGAERPFSPVVVSASIAGAGAGSTNGVQSLGASQHLQRSALTLAGGILYVPYCGYADTDPYHGWVLGFDPATLRQLTNYVFNTTPNSTTTVFGPNAGEGGIWMYGGGLAVDDNTNLYFAVGNGSFSATNNSAGKDYGDSFIKLTTGGGLAVGDYFTPYNQLSLQSGDTDLGSGGVVLLPDQAGIFPRLMVGAGKEGKIYLINRDLMAAGNNHYNASASVDYVVQTLAGQITGSFATPAYFDGKVYFAARGDKLKAFALNNGLLSTTPVSTGPRTFNFPGVSPSVSANGTNEGMVWGVQMGAPAVLAAYDASNLTAELYNSSQAAANRDQLPNGVKSAVPTIAHGKVYVGGQYALTVFGLLSEAGGFASPNIAGRGTGILGVKDSPTSGAETPLFHAGAAGGINDGDLTTHVDTFNGGDTSAASFVGILWNQPVTNLINRLVLSVATFFDGGWFGVNNAGPGAGGALSAAYLLEPSVQITTNGGATWNPVTHSSDYLAALDGHLLPPIAFGAPTLAAAAFQLTRAQTGLNGIRLMGSEGGTASGGFLGVFELEVDTIIPQPAHLQNLVVTPGQFQFDFDTQPGLIHVVEFKDSLADPDWQTLLTVAGTGTARHVTDTLTNGMRVYRVRTY